MTSAKAEGGSARVDVVPVVVAVGNAKVTSVLGTVAVGVSDKGGLVVIVDEGVGDSDVVSSVGDLM